MTDDGIAQVLDKISEVSAELVEIRKSVALATQHFGDVDALQIDVEAIKKHLVKVDASMGVLTASLAELKRKQEREHQEDAEGVVDAGTADDADHRKSSRKQAGELVSASEAKQETINDAFRASLGRVEGAIFDILHASLKKQASIILGALVVIYILSRTL